METNPAPAKWLLAHLGVLPSGAVRMPLVNLTPAGQERVLALYAEAADLVPPPLSDSVLAGDNALCPHSTPPPPGCPP